MPGSENHTEAPARGEAATAAAPARARRRWPYGSAVVALLVGLVATLGLVLASTALNASNEQHLLSLRAKEVSYSVTAGLPGILTPLDSAASLADIVGVRPKQFRRLVGPEVTSGQPFISVSLWRSRNPGRSPVEIAGARPELGTTGSAAGFLTRAAARRGLSVIGLLRPPRPRIGYAFAGTAGGPFVAYGENALPPNRITRVLPGAPYSDVDYALYFGRSTSRSALLLASTRRIPLPGRHAQVLVPFGNAFLTLVVSPRRALGGTLPQRLPWAIGLVGTLLTLSAWVLTSRLISRRGQAERLARQLEQVATENQRLYAEQRGIAQTLQQALLPDVMPQLNEVRLSARYEAGVEGIDVGGDWYDLISLPGDRLLMVVGDVSGRGLKAATSMASLRFAIHYAAQDESPEAFLPKLSTMRRLRVGGQIATILCVMIDLRTREVTLTSAGHLPPLMVCGGESEFLTTAVGLPVGIDDQAQYTSTRFTVPAGATLLGFTDGLIERRGEILDEGLERLRRVAEGAQGTLDELMSRVLTQVRGPDSEDDTAIAGIQWLD